MSPSPSSLTTQDKNKSNNEEIIIMFQVEVKSEILKETLSVISILVDEVKLKVTGDKILLNTVDPAHVAMLSFELESAAFESFKADETELGVDIGKLNDVLKLAKPGDPISIMHDEKTKKLIIKVLNITRSMSLIDTSAMVEPKTPNMTLPVKVVIATAELNQGIKASESISDHVVLSASPDGFELSAEGETDDMTLRLSKDQLDGLECKEPVTSKFALNYFLSMVKAAQTSKTITMHLGTDYPVKLEFKIADDHGKVSYLLAPRIESESS